LQKHIFAFFQILQKATRCATKLNKISIKHCLRQQKNFTSEFQASLSLLSDLDLAGLSDAALQNYHKLLKLNFLGQLLGLPTLHSITEVLGLSNALQKSKNKIHKSLTMSGIAKIYNYFFQSELEQVFADYLQKDSSIWSKVLLTAVLDDSVFRQWLQVNIAPNSAYGKFFSGQFNTGVYGYDVLLMGFNVGTLLPLSLPEKMPIKSLKNGLRSLKNSSKSGNNGKKNSKIKGLFYHKYNSA